jgi:hypothetical protein
MKKTVVGLGLLLQLALIVNPTIALAETYDDASWHYGGNFPKSLPQSAASTHIGMFVAWAVLAGLGNSRLLPDSEIHGLKSRTITPGSFLIKYCDEKFFSDELNDEGNAFAKSYYSSNLYLDDYGRTLGDGLPSLYAVSDSWQAFDKLRPVIDKRYREWKAKLASQP